MQPVNQSWRFDGISILKLQASDPQPYQSLQSQTRRHFANMLPDQPLSRSSRATTLGLVQSGELRALATTGPARSPFLPDVPTMVEAGYPLLKDVTWFGFFVPVKTPPDIIEGLNGSIQAALRTSEIASGLAKLSVEIDSISMGDFAQLLASESARWEGIVQVTGFSPND